MPDSCCLIAKLCQTIGDTWPVAQQAPRSMGFLRQEYWRGLPFPSPGDLLNSWIEPTSPASPALKADSSPAEPLRKPTGIKTDIPISGTA